MMIRAMSPAVIITDQSVAEDADAIEEALNAGIKSLQPPIAVILKMPPAGLFFRNFWKENISKDLTLG